MNGGALYLVDYFKVKDVAEKFQKSEETIKRWIRSGRIPNAIKKSDKEGWLIPISDIEQILLNKKNTYYHNSSKDLYSAIPIPQRQKVPQQQDEIREIIILAFQAATMSSPTEELIGLLEYVGVKRTLEILLIMRQSPNQVKNHQAFIKKAIQKGWTPSTIPLKLDRKKSRLPSLSSQDNENYHREVPFYNWLEED